MALIKGENTNVDLASAETYFSTRLDVAAWTAATDPLKESALVTATALLDELKWAGVAVSATQSLAHPRTGTYFDPRMGTSLSLSSTAAVRRIEIGTCEMAYHLLNNDGLLDDVGSVINLSLGSTDLSRIKAPSVIPSFIRRNLKPLLTNQGSSAWWRAN